MAALNPLTRELVFKIVFYGPGLGGKTTTLQAIHERTKPEHRGKLVSLATPTERTLYFDFLPVRVPRIRNLNVRLQLFTVPGQVYFSATRKLVLTGADGIVFVADSQQARMDANQESLEDLSGNLAEHSRSLSQIAHTFQWNKRDIEDVVTEGELDRRFNLFAAPTTATVAPRGVGVFESLEKITRLVVEGYKAQMPHGESTGIAALDPDDLGIEEAVRELAESDRAPKSGPSSSRGPRQETRTSSQTKLAPALAQQVATVSPLPVTAEPPPPAPEGSLSFAPMWPEEERHAVRRAESHLAGGDWQNAVLSCDLLVARVLASGASLAGTLEAPRDPAVVALLLGLAGPRYLAFRSTVRAARRKEPITPEAAFSAFLFAIEARRARLDVE
ncbi:MAG TPA: GTPase domain-containing protein [Polyangiaceae bacterium]|jgi:signal recognition particle receptor subunit beta|nr:GTPase domain-containing protein [Polyangiaceae bacterium]